MRAFLNSVDIEQGTDDLSTAASAQRWMRTHGIPASRQSVSEPERQHLVEVREALRDLLAARESGEPVPTAAHAVLDRAAREHPLRAEFPPAGEPSIASAAAGAGGLIGRVLAEVTSASIAGTWARLKVCRNDACRWAFYDASKNHSGVWCSMAICGNRSKGRAFRGRRRRPARA